MSPTIQRLQKLRQLEESCPPSCPPEAEYCGNRPKHDFSSKCFDSIKEARAFITFKVPEMSPQECTKNAEKIKRAEKMVRKADRRNQKRKLKREGAPFLTEKINKPLKEVTRFEETLGPNGEIIRFKLIGEDGIFKKRVRTREEPPIGSIILDLTDGVKAWKRFSDKRRSTPVTQEMRRTYQNSLLFRVRQLAAGKINLQQFADSIKHEKKVFKSAKLRRKNPKNRK